MSLSSRVNDLATRIGLEIKSVQLSRRTPLNSRAVAIGDSITAANSNGTFYRVGDMWFNHLCMESKQQIQYAGYFGTPGATMAAVTSTHIPSVLAMNPRPGACFIMAGTNDVSAGTTAGALKTTLDSATTALLRAGILPILSTIPPRGDSTAANDYVQKFNTFISRYARNNGFQLLDAHGALVGTAGGWADASLQQGDNIHPSQKGHRLIAHRGLNMDIQSIFPSRASLSTKGTDSTNLIPSGQGMFLTDANADGIADGFTAWGTSTRSIKTPNADEDLHGNWQVVTKPASSSGNSAVQRLNITGWSVGDTLQLSFRYRTEGIEAAGSIGSAYLQFTGAASAESTGGLFTWYSDVTDGFWLQEMTVPVGTTTIAWNQQIGATNTGGSASVYVGELSIKNLSALGVLV